MFNTKKSKNFFLSVSILAFLTCLFFFSLPIAKNVYGLITIYSYINSLTVSPTPFDPSGDSDIGISENIWEPTGLAEMEISFNQEKPGFVVGVAYPLISYTYTDEDGSTYEYEIPDGDRPFRVFGTNFEETGSKTIRWNGMDYQGNIIEEGRYSLQIMIYEDYQYLRPVSQTYEEVNFEITYHLNQ